MPKICAEARGFFEHALALDPGNLDALLGTAAVDMQVAAGYQTDDRPVRFAAVEATLTKVLSQSPNNAWAHYLDVQGRSPDQSRGPRHCRM